MPTANREALIDELIALEDEVARRRLIPFIERTSLTAFRPAWYHRLIAWHLQEVFAGRIKRLMLFTPPQHGKSTLVSRHFPAWALGNDPNLRIVSASHTARWADAISRDVQRIMESTAYRQIFPATKLSSGKDIEAKTVEYFQVVGKAGSYSSIGVGGALTGKTADIGIIDDPVIDRHHAESEIDRQTIWDWYTSVFRTRQFGTAGRSILVMTRWHEDDLAGRLLEHAKKEHGDQWTVLSLPALAEERRHPMDKRDVGEPHWPEQYPLEELLSRKSNSEYEWAAMYQQRPAPLEGGLIKRGWWKYYDPSVLPNVNEILISLDPAAKDKQVNDYWAAGVWGKGGSAIYGLNNEKGHWDLPKAIERMLALRAWCLERWPYIIPTIGVENTAAGPEIIAALKSKVPGVLPLRIEGDKTQRVHAVLPALEGGSVYLPGRALPDGRFDTAYPWEAGSPISVSWVDSFIEECSAFPFGTHDDQVDQLSQALRRLYMPRAGFALANIPGL